MSAALHLNGCGNSTDDSALRSPPLSARTPGPVPASAPYMVSGTSAMLDSEYLLTRSWTSGLIVLHWCCSIIISSASLSFTDATVHKGSPQAQRRDIGLAVTHRSVTVTPLLWAFNIVCVLDVEVSNKLQFFFEVAYIWRVPHLDNKWIVRE